ncbi:uncharacterized protein K02A2.6-like [Ornithodoros turicata]|uniref:uncharacterized protein K02A2.6-like n=1 Tax=Ornithodoros turicata TaxID=34597 RepID=UPI003138CCF6
MDICGGACSGNATQSRQRCNTVAAGPWNCSRPGAKEVVDCLRENRPVQGSYKPFSGELTEVEGMLFKGTKVVVPRALRKKILERIHEGHLGINKCRARARQTSPATKPANDIAALIRRCHICQKFAYQQSQEPLMMQETPSLPWRSIGVDLVEYAGKTYITAYGAFSNYPEVERLREATAEAVIKALCTMFARHGIPLELCSDNGPQFTSKQFQAFAEKCDFKHITSSLHFPRSNGLAEKGAQELKRILKKTSEANEDFWLGLLSYRSAPLDDCRSPSELLMGCRIMSRLPDFSPHIPVAPTKRQQACDSGVPLRPLQEGDLVRIR